MVGCSRCAVRNVLKHPSASSPGGSALAPRKTGGHCVESSTCGYIGGKTSRSEFPMSAVPQRRYSFLRAECH
eukprot:6470661-Amphidinium_carterae.1